MMTDVKQVPLILDEWDKRGQLIRTSRGIEFVLGMRRATLDLAVKLQAKTSGTENLELKREIGKIWLKSAKIARKYISFDKCKYIYFFFVKILHISSLISSIIFFLF